MTSSAPTNIGWGVCISRGSRAVSTNIIKPIDGFTGKYNLTMLVHHLDADHLPNT